MPEFEKVLEGLRVNQAYLLVRAKIDHHAMPLAAGTRLGNYEIVGALGAGGMGEVYRGCPAGIVADPRLDARSNTLTDFRRKQDLSTRGRLGVKGLEG